MNSRSLVEDVDFMKESGSTFQCRFCGGTNHHEVLNLGNVALAGGFLKETEVGYEEKYPLKVLFCEDCFAVQVEEHVDPNVLFDGYFYFSSELYIIFEPS